jgi:sugar lactone lactonase YvrE
MKTGPFKATPIACLFFLSALLPVADAQSSVALLHPRDQIALQLGAIQMGYDVPFQIVGNPAMAQRAANALVMGRNALDATVAKPAIKVAGFVDSPDVDSVEYRDQLYQAVEAVVTSPVFGSIRGTVSLVGGKRQTVSATLSLPPNSYTVPVPYALEAATSVDAMNLGSQFEVLSGNMTAIESQSKSLSANLSALKSTMEALSANFTSIQQSLGSTALSNFINFFVSEGVIPDYSENVTVSTLAGNGNGGFANGVGTDSTFDQPEGVAVDSIGNVYVADKENHAIRKITPAGVVTTLAGNGVAGYSEGSGSSAKFDRPQGVAVDSSGNIYVADTGNDRIRKITPSGNVSTLAGNGTGGYADGSGLTAKFDAPRGVAVDSVGNVYVADTWNSRVRKITPVGVVTTLAGTGKRGYSDGAVADAKFCEPEGVSVDSFGNVYVADTSNFRIRKITSNGQVSTLAGNSMFGVSDGTGSNASFSFIVGLVVDASGNIFVADSDTRIRKISQKNVVTTLAGTLGGGFRDGAGNQARFAEPRGIAIDSKGSIYVSDTKNNRIRKITFIK